jgi:CNT family concentrative nucleoside transporter
MERGLNMEFRGILGIIFLLFLAWAISEDCRRVPWRIVLCGGAAQFLLALLLLKLPVCNTLFLALNQGATAVE